MEDNNDNKAQFIPFHAINEFMRDDFRLDIIKTTLNGLDQLPSNLQKLIGISTRKAVTVPGFRNSTKAPTALRAKATTEAFEKNPKLVAAFLTGWSELYLELRQQVYDMLIDRGWKTFPPEADRTKLPGFMIRWPEGEEFDTLNDDFRKRFPQTENTDDEISLMVVWISVRLPYQFEQDLFSSFDDFVEISDEL